MKLITRTALLAVLVVASLLAACASAMPAIAPFHPVARDYWPTAGWQTASPADVGLDAARLDDAKAAAQADLPFLRSLLVVRHGRLAYEAYFNGLDRSSLNDVHSVTKSVTSMLAGIAVSADALHGADATLSQAAPRWFEGGRNADKRDLTLRNVLSMRSGVQWDENALVAKTLDPEKLAAYLRQDVDEVAFAQPMAGKPGATWNYSELDYQLASAAVEGATGRSLKDYAAEHLFAPLGITAFDWSADASGHTVGGATLHLTARDMAKLGYLYLNGGQWDGQQIVPTDWVRLTTTPQATGVYSDTGQTTPIEWYGMGWWTWSPRLFAGTRAISARGYGGQLIVFLPAYDTVVVTTADGTVEPDEAALQERAAYGLIIDKVLPALTDAPPSDPFWTAPEAPLPPHYQLYAARGDGSNLRTVASDPAHDLWGAAWSPDGRQIVVPSTVPAVVSPGNANGPLTLLDASGRPVRELLRNNRSNYLPSWSPDGTRVAYISQGVGGQAKAEIYRIDADGSNEKRLTDNSAMEYGVAWSSDSGALVFGSQRDGDWGVYTMNPDGSDQKPLPHPASGHTPSWSHDGKRILFVSERDGNADIYMMDADGSNQQPLTHEPGNDFMPALSPDGTRIAFVSDRDGGTGIYVMNADGSGAHRVSPANINATAPSWSPDGGEVLFSGTETAAPSLLDRIRAFFNGGSQ